MHGLKMVNEWRATVYHSPSGDLNRPFNWEAGAKQREIQLSDRLLHPTAQLIRVQTSSGRSTTRSGACYIPVRS
jgi:hypothetical protein